MKKVVAVLGISNYSIPQKVEFARVVVASMTGNANFPVPSPTLATITANATALETAYVAAQTGGHDEHALMYAKEFLLELSLKAIMGYVEPIANANLVNAEAIVLSSGLRVKRNPTPKPNGFRLALTGNPGEVLLRTDFDSRATFKWEKSLTPYVEESWEELHNGTRAKFLVTGLARGTLYYFRVAKVDKDGQHPWSTVLYCYVP